MCFNKKIRNEAGVWNNVEKVLPTMIFFNELKKETFNFGNGKMGKMDGALGLQIEVNTGLNTELI